ncbi:pentapeptide repeat-containing protein [Streptomyces phaeochromogenes]|uniref:Pentapeptide repeat-containing protein n=1 Tax=Streptomyces phaeochromogenes TaxID=1923 RepID=A0ABZ1HV80_STRPH|nr:pentapeptide repeat-containing protein [Streptomyces phaeochromogenes]WSD21203.1 pentapeptide repeat-containing protein [Streptomyces phaeochromogenes]
MRILREQRQRRTERQFLWERMTELDQRRARARRKERTRRRAMAALIVAGAVVLFVVLPWLIWWGPYVIDADRIDETEAKKGSAALVTGLRTAVVAFTAALGAGIALLYTARTYRLNRRGQITDRFTKALERLGSGEIYVRIGGILALEQIVRDAPEQAATDAAHVLGHFIRHHAPRTAPPPDPDDPHRGPHADPRPCEPAADVQAALTALTRTESRTHVDPRERLNLQGLHLADAQLTEADLTWAGLDGAVFTEALLYGAVFRRANLEKAVFTGAGLYGAMFMEAHLRGAVFTRADLSGAVFTRADLSGAVLTDANLSGAMLTDANLRWAVLTDADLRWADLSGARGLTPKQVTSAVTDEHTELPARFYGSVGAPEDLEADDVWEYE